MDVGDAVGHPGGGVVFRPGAHVPGERNGVPAGADCHLAVVEEHRVPVKCVLHQDGDVTKGSPEMTSI